MEIIWRVISGNGEDGINRQNRQGEIENNVGNVEAKDLINTTHGHEIKGGC